MRAALILAFLLAAGPVAAQPTPIPSLQLDALRMEQEAALRRMIDQQNQLMAAEAKGRADEAALQLQLQRDLPPRPPELRYEPAVGATPGAAATPVFSTTPEAALADSNRRVQEAARNRR